MAHFGHTPRVDGPHSAANVELPKVHLRINGEKA
jgi:hypothetical protein